MAQVVVGIDIGDDLLSAAVVTGTGREAQVTDCAFSVLRAAGEVDLAGELALLIEKLREKPIRCVAGIPLSCLSLRNLALPFTDEKKIRQILPFELEEQLLRPLDEQIVATGPAAGGGTGLLAAAAEKGQLREQIEAFQASGLEPDRICPSVYVLADRLCRTSHTGDTFLFLHGDLASVQTALVRQGEIVFMRRLAWPDSVFTHAVFCYENGAVSVADPVEAEAAISSICGQARQSVDYFCLQSGIDIQPEYFALSGPIQSCLSVLEQLEARLGLSGRTADLVRDGAVSIAADCAGNWRPALHDAALALALQAGRKSKEAGLNFRLGEFAPPRTLFARKQLLAAAVVAAALLCLSCVWLFVDSQRLATRHNALTAQMERLFKESFPGSKPGPDPLLQMRSQRKAMDTTTAAMPLFAEEKRVLAILADISARIPVSLDLHTARLTVDQESVTLKGSTEAFNNVNAIQAALSASGRYTEAAIVSAAKGKEGEGIQFEIKLRLTAAKEGS